VVVRWLVSWRALNREKTADEGVFNILLKDWERLFVR